MATRDRWGPFAARARHLPPDTLAILDARVARLHPSVRRALPGALLVAGGEGLKRLAQVERILQAARAVPPQGTLLAVGGGTVGDVAAVAAHLHRRGVRLILVPTTLLAAVDSSLGGKGAVNVGGVKNAAGVFHEPAEVWICPELFATLTPAQRREGWIEAFKMAACLDAALWRAWCARPPPLRILILESRRLKREVCERDPRDEGERAVLNFGHTFGHALEAASGHRLPHGAAVRLGIACALDVGRALGVTPEALAREVEAEVESLGEGPLRAELARWLAGARTERVRRLLAADKKTRHGQLQLVLLAALGVARLRPVGERVWVPLLAKWRAGARP
jgi:3-dehydroquinate synthase